MPPRIEFVFEEGRMLPLVYCGEGELNSQSCNKDKELRHDHFSRDRHEWKANRKTQYYRMK